MLELKTYLRDELAEVLKTPKNNTNIENKLNTFNVEYTAEGKGKERTYNIINIPDEFKVYCVTELDFKAQTSFYKLKYFVYYFFNDDKFRTLTADQMGKDLDCESACRQTVSKWYKQFEKLDLFITSKSDSLYFSVYNGERTEITQEKYKEAWAIYWDYKSKGYDYWTAMHYACHRIGGYPLRIYKIHLNAFYIDIINKLTEYAVKSINNDGRTVQFPADEIHIDLEE